MPAGSQAGGTQPTVTRSSGRSMRVPPVALRRRQQPVDARARARPEALVDGQRDRRRAPPRSATATARLRAGAVVAPAAAGRAGQRSAASEQARRRPPQPLHAPRRPRRPSRARTRAIVSRATSRASRRAARQDLVDARRIGAQRVGARADAREVGLHALEQHLLAVDAADARGRAADVHLLPGARRRRRTCAACRCCTSRACPDRCA